jgi:hypothetical protein
MASNGIIGKSGKEMEMKKIIKDQMITSILIQLSATFK